MSLNQTKLESAARRWAYLTGPSFVRLIEPGNTEGPVLYRCPDCEGEWEAPVNRSQSFPVEAHEPGCEWLPLHLALEEIRLR